MMSGVKLKCTEIQKEEQGSHGRLSGGNSGSHEESHQNSTGKSPRVFLAFSLKFMTLHRMY